MTVTVAATSGSVWVGRMKGGKLRTSGMPLRQAEHDTNRRQMLGRSGRRQEG